MNRKLWYLKQINLFKSLPESQLSRISARLSERNYAKRQVVFEPEDRNKVFILKSGRVEIYQLTPLGKKIIVDVLAPGNIFGDLGIDEASDHFVEATTDSFVCYMPKGEFFDMIAKNAKVANALIRELFTKIVESEKQVAALASDNILTKFTNLLVRLAKKHGERKGDQVVITTKFTHEQLADMIGISRPTMTELLSKLERQGIIKREGKIISYDPQKLAEL